MEAVWTPSVIGGYGRLVLVVFHDVTRSRNGTFTFYALVFRDVQMGFWSVLRTEIIQIITNLTNSFLESPSDRNHTRVLLKIAL